MAAEAELEKLKQCCPPGEFDELARRIQAYQFDEAAEQAQTMILS